MEKWGKFEERCDVLIVPKFSPTFGFASTRGEVYYFSTPGIWLWPGDLLLQRDISEHDEDRGLKYACIFGFALLCFCRYNGMTCPRPVEQIRAQVHLRAILLSPTLIRRTPANPQKQEGE